MKHPAANLKDASRVSDSRAMQTVYAPLAILLLTLIWLLSSPGMATKANAQTLAPAFTSAYSLAKLGSVPGVPTNYGGLTFKAGDPNTLLIGGQANSSSATIHAITVVRGAGRHITGFSGTSRVFANAPGFNNSGGIDGGLTYGPGNVLFYTAYSNNSIGQLKPGSSRPDKLISLTALGIRSSVGSLMFVPPGQPGAGRLKILSYNASTWYDTTVSSDGTGTFNIAATTRSVAISGGPEGAIYVPSRSPLFSAPAVLISEYQAGKVGAYAVNSNGDPIPATRRDFVTGLSGAEGAAVDPLTGDFLFSTFGGGSQVIAVRGFAAPQPSLSISDAARVTEGNSGTRNATFTVTLTPSSTQTMTVAFATANGTATAGSDYTATTGTLTFSPGQTTKTITVPIRGDVTNEPNETFFVNLTRPTNTTLTDAQGLGTIITDDIVVPVVSISDASVQEGGSGTVTMSFVVRLSSPATQTVTVRYATADSIPVSAIAGTDYIAKSGILTFAPGQQSQAIQISIVGDTQVEKSEQFFVNLSNAVGATIGTSRGSSTILNFSPAQLLSDDRSARNGSPVIKANTADATLTLRFPVALAAPTTNNYGNYKVEINGHIAPVLGVQLNADEGLVTLLLPEHALQISNAVSVPIAVTWSLQSGTGATLNGTQTLILK